MIILFALCGSSGHLQHSRPSTRLRTSAGELSASRRCLNRCWEINALKRHISVWHGGVASGGRRAEYINGKMQNIYRENIDMIGVAYWNNTEVTEVTEVTGRERKRIEVLMHRT